MTISVFDRFQNMIPTTVFDAADVSMVILIDPPDIPSVFMKNKGVLSTTDKKIYIYGDDGSTVAHTFDISKTDLGPINEEIAALKTRVGANEGDIAQLKIDVPANTAEIALVKATANNADALSKTNAALLVDALLKDEYGWDVDNLNVYNVSRLSRTNNSVNSSGVSIGDTDVNLHGDTVGITSSNSSTTYAVFSAGGININDFPLTRMGSGGDTDTNAANIGDVKRIATDGSGLKPIDETWDMLGYTVLNVGTSDEVTSAATVGQVNTVDSKASTALSTASSAQTTATSADTLSKTNKQRLDNLPPAPDLSKYAELLTDVAFHKITATGLDFTGSGATAVIQHDQNIDVKIDGSNNVAFKSSGMKLLNNVDGDGHTINNAGDIHFNSNKKIFGSGAGNLQIRYTGAIYRGDGDGSNIQFDAEKDIRITGDHVRWFHTDGHQYGGISKTGVNLRDTTKIVGLPQGSDDTDATNLGHIKELIDASGGGGIEFKVVKANVTGSPQYYYHDGNNHMFIEYTGSGGTVALDSMRPNSPDQVEDMVVIHNKTDVECYIRLFFNGSSVTHGVKPRSFLHGWANRTIEQWVVTTMKDPAFTTEQKVISLDDLAVNANSDPRQVTKNIIAAMPNSSVLIAKHNPNAGTSKYRFINNGEKNKVEGTTCIAVISKNANGEATGMSTTSGGSGKAWSRVLDGSRGCWFTNDTANTRMASVDIDPADYQENQLFFTTDQGLMETYIEDDASEIGVVKLRAINGYNTPKNEADIAALGVQTEKNRSVTHYFINETNLSYDWPDSERKPLVEVQVLNTTQIINNSDVTVTDNNDGKYSGTYNAVGAIAINSSGYWANVYTYHNAYKHDSSDYYVVFNQGVLKWQIIEAANPHTSIGEHAASVTINLGDASSLPASFGDYEINPNFDNIDSLEFMTAEVPVQYDDVNSTVIINFNGAKPSGYVVLK